MPTYDYQCRKCHHEFEIEATVSEKEKLKPECPKCGSTNTSQLFKRLTVVDSDKSDNGLPDIPEDDMAGMPPMGGMGMPPGMCGPGGYCGGYPGM
jgi:putative FmdB family regulatory protein